GPRGRRQHPGGARARHAQPERGARDSAERVGARRGGAAAEPGRAGGAGVAAAADRGAAAVQLGNVGVPGRGRRDGADDPAQRGREPVAELPHAAGGRLGAGGSARAGGRAPGRGGGRGAGRAAGRAVLCGGVERRLRRLHGAAARRGGGARRRPGGGAGVAGPPPRRHGAHDGRHGLARRPVARACAAPRPGRAHARVGHGSAAPGGAGRPHAPRRFGRRTQRAGAPAADVRARVEEEPRGAVVVAARAAVV
ncbi:hypothetical protein LPJ70_006542, partial [Coemansia sp. RSA 2708]